MAIFALIALAGAGCGAATIEDTAYHGARGAVRGSVDELRTLPELQALKDLKADAKINAAAHDLAEAVVTGAGDGAKKLEIDQQVKVLIQTVMEVAQSQGNQLVASMIDEQGPRIEKLARDTLAGTIEGAGDQLKRTAETDLPGATSAVIDSAVDAFAGAMESEKMGALKQDLVKTSGEVTQNASAGAVRGLREELAKPETLDAFGALAQRVVEGASSGAKQSVDKSEVRGVVIALGSVLALTVAALIFYIRKTVLTTRALTLIAQQINKGGHDELKGAIKQKAEQKKLEAFLSMFLLDRGL